MKPLMIHHDGIVCFHRGVPKATVDDEGGPVCAGGVRVSHALVNDRKVAIGEAWPSLVSAYGPPRRAAGRKAGER